VSEGTGERRFLSTPYFFLFLLYVQAVSLASLVLLLMGVDVPHGQICEHLLRILGTRFLTSPRSSAIVDDTRQPVIFLCNHRSWGDFWVDTALLGGTSFVARQAVACAIPCSAAWGWLRGWLWFFQRGAKHKEGSTKWMANFLQRSHTGFPSKGVVLYPEGTRSLLPNGSQLKFGSLAAIHSLGWPVQVVISTNKEHVMAERRLKLGFGTQCSTAVSSPLSPHDFASRDAFISAVNATWQSTWREAYAIDTSGFLPRPRAALPGAVSRRGVAALARGAGLNRVRLLLVALVVFVMRFRGRLRLRNPAAIVAKDALLAFWQSMRSRQR